MNSDGEKCPFGKEDCRDCRWFIHYKTIGYTSDGQEIIGATAIGQHSFTYVTPIYECAVVILAMNAVEPDGA